jgi:hypothetical protein
MGNNVMEFLNALKAGQKLTNAGGWKVFQNWLTLGAAVLPIAGALIPGIGALMTPDVIAGAAAVVGSVNAYLTTATTDKIGV